jgi:hypothetical protein
MTLLLGGWAWGQQPVTLKSSILWNICGYRTNTISIRYRFKLQTGQHINGINCFILFAYKVQCWHKQVCSCSNTSVLYLGSTYFEPQMRHWLFWLLVWFSSVSPIKCLESASTLFHIFSNCLLITLPSARCYTAKVLTASLHEPKINKNKQTFSLRPSTGSHVRLIRLPFNLQSIQNHSKWIQSKHCLLDNYPNKISLLQ